MKSLFVLSLSTLLVLGGPENPINFGLPTLNSAIAQEKPDQSDKKPVSRKDRLDSLFSDLSREAKTAKAGSTARLIWKEWTDSGSDSVNALMHWAGLAMNDKKNAQALDLLDQVTVLMPEFAEGWNRRATLFFTMKQYGKSLADIEQTLRLEPRHFGALAGLGMILQQTDQEAKALETWYKVLEIYPANKQAQDAVIALEEKLADRRT